MTAEQQAAVDCLPNAKDWRTRVPFEVLVKAPTGPAHHFVFALELVQKEWVLVHHSLR